MNLWDGHIGFRRVLAGSKLQPGLAPERRRSWVWTVVTETEVDRATKEEQVASLHETFNDANSVVVTHYLGITAAEATDLRRRMTAAGARFRVTKNRLVKIALKDTPYEHLLDMFIGPTAIAFSDDPVGAAKASAEFAKENENLVILGGGLGDSPLDAAAVKNLASLPSLDELRGIIVGLLNAPATKIAGVLQAPAGQVARVIGAYAATTEDEAA
jgi:large subunit ribosomal protein L10